MEKLTRWIATHRIVVYIISVVILVAWNLFNASFSEMGIISFLIIFFAILLPDLCTNKIINRAIAKLNNECDPYPLLEESEFFLARKNKKMWEHAHLTNKYCALREMGRYREVYDGLSEMATKKYRGVSPIGTYVFYNNFVDICILLGKQEEEAELYAKMQGYFEKIKPQKQREQMRNFSRMREAAHLYCQGAYEDALKVLEQFQPQSLRNEISMHKLFGEIYLKQNDVEKARYHLQIVAEQGNRLYEVEEAKALLANIPTCEYI